MKKPMRALLFHSRRPVALSFLAGFVGLNVMSTVTIPPFQVPDFPE